MHTRNAARELVHLDALFQTCVCVFDVCVCVCVSVCVCVYEKHLSFKYHGKGHIHKLI